jgi:serine/threonine-protein kinase
MGDGYYQPEQRIPETQYICVRVIGEGGFGVVYAVRHYYTEQRFALKTLHASLIDRQDLAVRMRNEAKFLAGIRHPNVVPVIDGGITGDGRPFLVMEFLNGEPLSQTLAEAPRGLGLKWTLRLVELLDGLDIVHTKGAVHRDIKPANVFLQTAADEVTGAIEPRPILLDFGVSHFMRNQKPITGRMFLGTMRYAAPEQIRGEAPTPKTDLYSMGLVFYECLCGRGPFDDLGREDAVARAHLTQEPPHLSAFGRIDERVADLVMRMLAKDPAARPTSAGWLASAFRAIRKTLMAEHDVTAADANRTEPTPLDNRFITLSVPLSDRGPDPAPDAGPSTAPAAPKAIRQIGINDTVPDATPFQVVETIQDAMPMGGARTLLAEQPDPQRDRRTAEQAAPSVDRLAPTPTMDPFRAPKPTHGTTEILVEDDVYMPAPSDMSEPSASPVSAHSSLDAPGHGRRPSQGTSSSAAGVIVSRSRTAASSWLRMPRADWLIPAVAFLSVVLVGLVVLRVEFRRALTRQPAAATSPTGSPEADHALALPVLASSQPALATSTQPEPLPSAVPELADASAQGVLRAAAPTEPAESSRIVRPAASTTSAAARRLGRPGPGF